MKASGIIELSFDSGESVEEVVSYFKHQAEAWSNTSVQVEVIAVKPLSVTVFYTKAEASNE
jgi:hypothetical protein